MNFGTYIGTPPPNLTGQPARLRLPVPQTPAEGFDTLTERLWVPFSPFFAKGTLRHDAEGRGSYYVQDETVVDWQGGCPVVELVSRGLSDMAKAYKTAYRGPTLLDPNSPQSATWWKPDHARVIVWGVTLTKPVTHYQSLPLVPPETYGLPEQPWTRVNIGIVGAGATPVWRGNGWLLEDRQVDSLPGGGAHLFTDTYLYDFLLLDPDAPEGSRDTL